MADAFRLEADYNGNAQKVAYDFDGTVYTLKVLATGGSGASADQVQGAAAAGAAPVGNPVLMGGSDGAAVRTLLTTTTGAVANQEDGVADAVVTTASVSSAAVLVSVDTLGYGSVSFQFTSVGISNTIVFEGSNDNTNWVFVGVERIDSLTAAILLSTSTPAISQGFVARSLFRYFRLRVSVYGSGTVTAVLALRKSQVGDSTIALRQGSIQIGNVGGVDANDAAVSGNPVRVGARAQTAAITAVANSDAVDMIATRIGYLIVRPDTIPELAFQASGSLTTTTAATVKALTASQKQYLKAMQLQGLTNTVTGTLTILSNTTPIWTGVIPAGVSFLPLVFPEPLQTAAGEALNVQLGTTPVGAVAWNAQGYTAP